jgi:hypothetical protein
LQCILKNVSAQLHNLGILAATIIEPVNINVSFTALETSILVPCINSEAFVDELIEAICGSAQTLKCLILDLTANDQTVAPEKIEVFKNIEQLRFYSVTGIPEVKKLKKKNCGI